MSYNIIVLILGDYINGLSIARCLRYAGFKGDMYNIGTQKNSICKVSRYTKYVYAKDFDQLQSILLNRFRRRDKIKILYYCTEAFLDFIIDNKDALKELNYRFIIPMPEIFEICKSKCSSTNLLSIPSPRIYNCDYIQYPAYFKLKYSWKNQLKLPRGQVVRNGTELNNYKTMLESVYGIAESDYIFQEILNLDPENNYSFCCIAKAGCIMKYGVSRKLLQRPIEFGTGCAIELVNDDAIRKLLFNYGRQIIAALDFSGICEIEFIKDGVDFKLIEINPRFWMQHEIFRYIGINFSAEYFNLCLEEPILKINDGITAEKIVWINELSLIYIIVFSKVIIEKYRLIFDIMLRQKLLATFRISDPLPAFQHIFVLLRNKLERCHC